MPRIPKLRDAQALVGLFDQGPEAVQSGMRFLKIVSTVPQKMLPEYNAWVVAKFLEVFPNDWPLEVLSYALEWAGCESSDIKQAVRDAIKLNHICAHKREGTDPPYDPIYKLTRFGECACQDPPPWVPQAEAEAWIRNQSEDWTQRQEDDLGVRVSQTHGKRKSPRKILNGYKDICDFLNLEYSESLARRLAKLSRKTNGPLHRGGKGHRPTLILADKLDKWFERAHEVWNQQTKTRTKQDGDLKAITNSALEITSKSAHRKGKKEVLIPDISATAKFKRR